MDGGVAFVLLSVFVVVTGLMLFIRRRTAARRRIEATLEREREERRAVEARAGVQVLAARVVAGGSVSVVASRPPDDDPRRYTLRPPPWLPVTRSKGPFDVYELVYRDPRGAQSTRVVRLSSIEDDTERVYLEGHCELTNGIRRFRADYVLRARNIRTGEVVADPVSHFKSLSREPPAASATHARALERAKPGLRVLLWIARSDRTLTAAEVAILVAFTAARGHLHAPYVDAEPALVRTWLDAERPTLSEAVGEVARMAVGGAERALVKAHVERLAASDGDDDGSRRRRARQILDHLG